MFKPEKLFPYDNTSTGGRLINWSAFFQHAISFTHVLHNMEDTYEIVLPV